MKDKEIKGN